MAAISSNCLRVAAPHVGKISVVLPMIMELKDSLMFKAAMHIYLDD